MRSLPWVASMERRYQESGLKVVGLHSPELERERSAGNVRAEVRRLGLSYPVVMDNEFRMWDALRNRYWPTIYLVDRKGMIRHVHPGETHEGDEGAQEFERLLQALLAEPS